MKRENPNPKIRILIAENYRIFREALRALLSREPNLEVAGEASDGLEAVRSVAKLQPDMVILDLSMPRASGMDAMAQITNISKTIRIIVLTAYDNDEYVFNAFRLGAKAYILKDAAYDELLFAIQEVQKGNYFISPVICRGLIQEYLKEGSGSPKGKELTGREQEFLRKLADHSKEEDIARALSIKPNTARKHRQKIMRKLRITTRSELISAAKNRYVSSESRRVTTSHPVLHPGSVSNPAY